MSDKRWRVISILCMDVETAPLNHDRRMPFFGAVTYAHEYEAQPMSVKRTRDGNVRVVATRLTEDEAIAMAKLLNASEAS